MTTNLLNAAVLREARQHLDNPKLKAAEILGWCAGQIEPADSTEAWYQLPTSGAWIIVKKTADHR